MPMNTNTTIPTSVDWSTVKLPISEEKTAALRFAIVGAVLIGLMAFRPQGAFGNRKEMVLGD